MPIRPPPFTFTCTACSWKKTTFPLSDALVFGRDCFPECPKCAGKLEMERATRAEVFKTRLEHFFK